MFKWLSTKEERSSAITFCATVIAALLLFFSGRMSVKSDVIELTKWHIEELNRQQALITIPAEKQKLELLLDSWRNQAKVIANVRESIKMAHVDMARESEFMWLKYDWASIKRLAEIYDDIGFLRFVRDHGSQKSRKTFEDLQRNHTLAAKEVEIYLCDLSRTSPDIFKQEMDSLINDLKTKLNLEGIAASAYYGSIEFASLKSLQETQ